MNKGLTLASGVLFCGSILATAQGPSPAAPTDAIQGVLRALTTHQVIGLGLGEHNSEQGHAFLLSLIRHPDFPAAMADLVVECGNARYQDTMDRFVAGDEVSYEILRRSWQDTTQPHEGCDVPLHEELYRAARMLNDSLPADRRLRVLLGDAPVDWDSPTARQDREKFMLMRDSYPAELIQREVLAKGRRAVVVYGQGHLQRRQMIANYEMSHAIAQTIVSLLERGGVRVFNVWGNTTVDLEAIQASVATWPRPSLVSLRSTNVGALDFARFLTGWSRFRMDGTKLIPIPREEWRIVPIEEQFDALLYLGPLSSLTTRRLSRTACADAGYMSMRLTRMEAYGPKQAAEQLKKDCAEVMK